MKKTPKIILTLAVFLMILFAVYHFYINKDARDIATEEPAFAVKSEQLIAEFTADGAAASKKYLNKTITISGTVSSTDEKSLSLEGGIYCQMMQKTAVKSAEAITVKGRLIGFDDILSEIKLDQCTIITN
jgi:hypothetical protein